MLTNYVHAQNSVYGRVLDKRGNPLKSVSVRMTSELDTLHKITDLLGNFNFTDFKGKNLNFDYKMLGYKSANKSMLIAGDKVQLEVPTVYLELFSLEIPDVNILKVIPVVVNGDTLQFNFNAFDFRKNSLLEDALKNLPGFQVFRDGSVTYNGKTIKRVKVDNRDFFGGDLLTATRNLPVDFIQNLQVIDFYGDKEQETGLKNGEPEKILNISLKDDHKKIYFGQATGGGGTNSRYLGSFGANKFDDGREISILGSFNNTNTNLFSFGNPEGGDRSRNSMDIGEYADPIDGLNEVSSAGVNVSDKWGEYTSFNATYNFVRQENVTDGISKLTSTYVGNTITKEETYRIRNIDQNHKMKFGFDTKFKNSDLLKIQGNLTFNQLNGSNRKRTDLRNYEKTNSGVYRDSTSQISPNGDLEAMYSKSFRMKGRKLVANILLNSNNVEKRESVFEEYDEAERNVTRVDSGEFRQNQFIKQNNYTNSTKASVSYVEPFLQHSLFEFSYEFDITRIEAIRQVEDKLPSVTPLSVNSDSLTVDYDYFFRNNKTGVTYQYEPNKRFKMNFGFAVQPLYMEGRLTKDNVVYKYENINLIPSANVIYRFSKNMDWQMNYKGKNNQPYFNQIAPVVDNTNSRNVIIGNPELKAESAHRVATTLRKTFTSRMQYFETNFAYNFILNKIVSDKRSATNSTVQETTFKNTSGYYDVRWYYMFNTPFINDDFQLDLTGNTDYYNNLSFIDEKKRTTKQLILTQSMQLKYAWSDYVESVFNANYVWNNTRYDIPFKTNINVETMFWGLGARGYLNDNLSLGLEMSQRYNNGYTSNFMNENQTIMNGFVEWTFFRNKSALLRLQGYDLFDQNKAMGIYSEYIGNDVYEAKNSRLGRYFMLSLNVRLQKFPKKK
ncbi:MULTISPECIES: outer membrane beta-barrel protein [Sphingobacterium]|uniref:outer membrane beta-barrel protein n=1 Tax=Sphingobacterium TaxID=28453 RepID=UPI0013DA80F4|nr:MULTISPECIES: outer membrane beta-barrel protein [unclassified Sphingobacterium]